MRLASAGGGFGGDFGIFEEGDAEDFGINEEQETGQHYVNAKLLVHFWNIILSNLRSNQRTLPRTS